MFDRLPVVKSKTGRSSSGTYADVKAGLLTSPIKLGVRASGWPAHEVDEIVRARIAGSTPEELRSLVLKLEAKRKEPRIGSDSPPNQVRLIRKRELA
ncbi:MAG: AlpA family phage regulatory protein [Steroidobacteraceae bacterium]